MRDVVFAALPGSHIDIMSKTGIGRTTAWRWLKALHAEGACHIKSWKRTPNGGPFVPVYVVGPGEDARCRLKPFSEKEKSARYRTRARADGSWEDLLACRRARAAADRASFMRDPLMAGLFGSRPAQEAANNMHWRKAG